MHIDEARLLRIAETAMIEINKEEVDKYLDLLNKDIESVKEVFNIDTGDLEGLANPYDMVLHASQDRVSDGNIADKVLKNAPNSMYGYFVVPKIIEA